MKQNLDVRNLDVTKSSLQYNENNPGAQTYTRYINVNTPTKDKYETARLLLVLSYTFFIINFIREKPL